MYLVTYPDYIAKEIDVILYKLSVESQQIILPMLFDNLPEESVIVLGDNLDWIKKFKNAHWFTEDETLNVENLFFITDIESAAESCTSLLVKINNVA